MLNENEVRKMWADAFCAAIRAGKTPDQASDIAYTAVDRYRRADENNFHRLY